MARRGTAASINLVELEKLAALQCTDEEIAGWFGVSTRTIERRRKSRVFAETMERGRAKGRISIRRAQLKMLEDGSATMGIWLGKQYLGQTDEININSQPLVLVVAGSIPPQVTPPPRDTLGVDAASCAANTIDVEAEETTAPGGGAIDVGLLE